jgi:hypothetical protein
MPIIDHQQRFVELGRLRMGAKGDKGQPQKLATWRLTSASRQLLDAAAQVYGGTVRDWQNAPNDGYFELVTETAEIDVTIPPVESPGALLSQWYELWSAGGCARRCDGVTEGISGKPCLCNPAARECKPVTRMSVMLPRLPGIGVWRLDTGGANAALELPGTFQFLAGVGGGRFVEATLRIEQRVKKVPGEGTRRFAVPVLNVPGATVGDLMASANQGVIGPAIAPRRPELPAAAAPPSARGFDNERPDWGERPALPAADPEPDDGDDKRTAAQTRKLNVLVGQLRDQGHITTEQLYRAMGRDLPDGELHWSPLRDSLTKQEANQLIDRLSKLQERVGSPFQAPASVTT